MSDYQKVHYKNPFLKQVIIRCDFSEFVSMEKIFSQDIINKIRDGFPFQGKIQIIHFGELDINLPPGSNMQLNTKQNITDGRQITFKDNNGNKLIVSNKFLICEVNCYDTFDKILCCMTPVINAVFATNSVAVFRTGIRYINFFDNDKIKIRKKFFQKNVALAFENKLPVNVGDIKCIRSMHISEYKVNEMQLTFRYGMFNPDYPEILRKNNFVLDYDCYYNGMVCSEDEVVKYLNMGHDAIQTLFENSITDSLREVYRGE